MSSGLLIDQSCASLPIPKLFPKVGKSQILIHKLDSTLAFSTGQPRWDCFWYQGLAQDVEVGSDLYFEPTGTIYKVRRGMRIDTYC
jgi:hypothetical protein